MSPLSIVFVHRRKLVESTKVEYRKKFAGSILGSAWSFLGPLLLMSVYAVIYLVIFQVRVPGLLPSQYVILVLSGLAPFLMLAESLGSGLTSFSANRQIAENSVYPVELLVPRAVLSSQGPMVVASIVFLLALLWWNSLRLTFLLIVPIWILLIASIVGATWLLSAVAVLVKDLPNTVAVGLMILLISSPFAYTPDMVPDQLRLVIYLNPFAYFVIGFQQVIVYGSVPSLMTWLAIGSIAGASLFIGSLSFMRLKRLLIDHV